jgi:hypothetical protein
MNDFNVIRHLSNGIKPGEIYVGQQSDLFSCYVGVRQGENLSPFLFAIFLNDLEDYMDIKEVILFLIYVIS